MEKDIDERELSHSPPPALPPPKRNPRKTSVRVPCLSPLSDSQTSSGRLPPFSEEVIDDIFRTRKPVPLPRKSIMKVVPHNDEESSSPVQPDLAQISPLNPGVNGRPHASSPSFMTDLDEPVEGEDGYLDYEGVRVFPNTETPLPDSTTNDASSASLVRSVSLVSDMSSNLMKWESVEYLSSSLDALNFHQSEQDPDIWSVYESDNIPPGYSPPVPPAEDELLGEQLIDVPPPPLPPRPTRTQSTAAEIEKSRPALPLPAGRNSIIQLESETRNGVATLRGGFLTLRQNQKEVGKRWCVLKDGKLSIYTDRKSVSAKLTIPCSDIMDISVDKTNKGLCAFALCAMKDRNRPVSFVAESTVEAQSWLRALAKNICDSILLHMTAMKAGNQNFDVASRIFVKNGVSGMWRKSWMELRGRTLTILDEESDEEYDLRKALALNVVNIEYYESKAAVVCAEASEESKPFILNMPGRTLYFQGDVEKSTAQWMKLIQQRSRECGPAIEDQPLTSEDVPVIVQKCIAFVERHGLKTEGIYRHNGVSSRIAAVLDCFTKDAHSCHLSLENFTVHDVSGALKRFLRTLPEPVIKFDVYQPLLHCAEISDVNQRLQKYKSLLKQLPQKPNYVTLKKLCGHLRLVSESDNKMPVQNIAASFGSTIMSGGMDNATLNTLAGDAFESSKNEITVLIDFLTFYEDLFDVKEEDMIKERKILQALENFNQHIASPPRAGDFLMGVYWIDRKGDAVNLRIGSRMTAGELCHALLNKENMTADTESYALHEIILDDKLTRVVLESEEVIPIILRWTAWNESNISPYSSNYLCVRKNVLHEKLSPLVRNPLTVFQQLRVSKEKSFKKVAIELNKLTFTCFKSPTGEKSIGSWSVQDLLIFRGCSPQRSPPSKWSFTFVEKESFMDRLKENRTAFGYTICCDEENDLMKWLAALMQSQKLAFASYSSTPTLRASNFAE